MKASFVSVALAAASIISAYAQAPSPRSNIAGDEQFCLKSVPGGDANCIYQTMGACEIAKKAANSSGECINSAQLSGTTSSNAPSPPPTNPPANPPAEIPAR